LQNQRVLHHFTMINIHPLLPKRPRLSCAAQLSLSTSPQQYFVR
jgi:hypothetical protein